MKVINELGPGRAVLVIVPSELYRKNQISITKQVARKYNRILYVALNESCESMTRDFKEQKIPLQKFYYIDARASATRVEPKAQKNCLFVSSPEALTELKIAISKSCETRGPEVTIFDSLSTLLSYLPDGVVARWTHDVVAKLRECHSSTIFLCLKRDEDSYLVKDITMFVDKVIRLTR